MLCATLCLAAVIVCHQLHTGTSPQGCRLKPPSPAQCGLVPAPVGQHMGRDSETQQDLG